MEAIKRLPIGISDFKTLQRSQKYFVDKTKYLPLLEKISNFLFLIRPRRFGKSLFLSMVADYFDCANKDIEKEYQGTWIETHPLESKGKFQILQFDFSQVLDRVENLETDFNTYCCSCLNQFVQKYQNYYTKDTVEWALAATTSKDKINILSKEAKERGYHLYLIIDEYDNFTNTVLNELGEDTYHNMTHSSGFYRNAFKIFKPNFERILFMGVSPITLNDLTMVRQLLLFRRQIQYRSEHVQQQHGTLLSQQPHHNRKSSQGDGRSKLSYRLCQVEEPRKARPSGWRPQRSLDEDCRERLY